MDLIDIGISRGISQGEYKNLISLISRKKDRHCSVPETAEMLEADIPLVQQVYDALEKYNAKTQWKEIMNLIQHPQ